MKRIALVVGLAALAATFTLNVAGIARFPGGPLREWKDGGALWLDMWPSDWGNNAGSNTPEADWARPGADLVYTSELSANDWPWPVEVERITPVDPSGNLVVSGTLLRRSVLGGSTALWAFGPLTADQRAILAAEFTALPGSVSPSDNAHQFAAVIRGPQQGPAGWETLVVDYRVGPFSFRVMHHSALHLCLGATPAERTCPETP